MPKTDGGLPQFYAPDRAAWRAWLEARHATATGVWLISFKKESGRPYVSYDESVEEALCFGWVDSRSKKLDDERSMQFFSPRKPRSPWSGTNKERVTRLIKAGLMTPAGLAKVAAAKKDGSWTMLDSVERLTVPADLREALAANEAARTNFEAFSNASKKNILWWIESAKRPETRKKRIAETVALAAQGLRANQDRK